MTTPNLSLPTPFEDILDELEQLARDHLLLYRVRVGGVLLRHFWNDDPAAYSSTNPYRTQRFQLFFDKHGVMLTRYGLSQRMAKDSIRACIVVRTLPSGIAQQLFLSQVLELVRLRDPTQRLEIAQAAIVNDWSVKELRTAVSAVRAGLPYDADLDAPGVQLPEAVDEQRPLAPGRLVTRAEKFAVEIQAWSAQWSTVDTARLKTAQRQRITTAVEVLEAEVAKLRGVLDRDG